TLIVVSHDRWFLERTCDVSYALLGDGSCVLLPGGVEEYLERRRAAKATKTPAPAEGARAGASDAARQRQARKDLARVETQLAKIENQITRLHGMLNDHAADYAKLVSLGAELDQAQARRDELEAQWLELAETVEPN
ncbi:MAG: ABC transporter ATP-binding protein, partial [Actinobacteria bacterium]|nr:ABC transporter ATP-binding protein [Actinomycetota bacterium]